MEADETTKLPDEKKDPCRESRPPAGTSENGAESRKRSRFKNIDQMSCYTGETAPGSSAVHTFSRLHPRTSSVCSTAISQGTLKLSGNIPVADNIPEPRRAFFCVPWVTQNMEVIRTLRIWIGDKAAS